MSEGDLYVYRTGDDSFVCQWCLLAKGEFTCATRQELLDHLDEHKRAGHAAPYERMRTRLEAEMAGIRMI